MQSTTEEDKLTSTQQFKEHVEEAQKERQFYLDCMAKAEESLARTSGRPRSYSHYTIDFAQQLQVPYHSKLLIKDTLKRSFWKNKMAGPNVSFIWRFHCNDYTVYRRQLPIVIHCMCNLITSLLQPAS